MGKLLQAMNTYIVPCLTSFQYHLILETTKKKMQFHPVDWVV